MFLESYLVGSSARGLSQKKLSLETAKFIRSQHPIKASYYLYITFRLAQKIAFLFVGIYMRQVHTRFRSSCRFDENDFSRQIFANLSAIQSDERFSLRFLDRTRNNNDLEGKTDRSTVLSFSLFCYVSLRYYTSRQKIRPSISHGTNFFFFFSFAIVSYREKGIAIR